MLAEQTDEWTEQRRYMGTEILTKARLTVIDGEAGTADRGLANHSDRRITSTRIYPVIDSYTITVDVTPAARTGQLAALCTPITVSIQRQAYFAA